MPTGFTGMGCGCCGCTVPFTVVLCNSVLSGATVTVKSGGTTIASGTTSGLGTVGLDIGTAGTYTVQVSKTGITTVSQSLALACGGGVVIELGPRADPLPLTDANGTISLPLQIGVSPMTWVGGYFITIGGTATVSRPSPGACFTAGSGVSGRIGICYTVVCNSDGTVQVFRTWLAVMNLSTSVWYYSNWPGALTDACQPGTLGCDGEQSDKTSLPSSFSPFAWSDTLTPAGSNVTTDPVGGTVTLG